MSKKVYISASNQIENTYAYGNTNEAIQCGKIAVACKVALERNGISVMLGQYDTMENRCAASDRFGADLHVPIHSNGFNGKVGGTRMFCYDLNGEGYKACKAIFNVLAPFTPGTSENIKANPVLFEVRVPNAPTAYVEVDFHDNPSIAKWIIEHTTEIGEKIAEGICNYFGIKFKDKVSAPTTSEMYRIRKTWTDAKSQIGAYRNLENAKKACKDGYSVFNNAGECVYSKAQKSVEDIAREVINGKWGNGVDRKNKLTAAGYNYDEVQKCVNKLLVPTKSIDELAREVLAGKWGNGADRKAKLTAAGYDYNAVQKRVNELV